MPRSRISEILSGTRRITPDTALRLAAFFRMKPNFWLALQAEWDLARCDKPPSVEPAETPGFLVGPKGAMPLPAGSSQSPPSVKVSSSLLEQLEAAAEPHDQDHDREWVEVRYPSGLRGLESRRT